MKHSTLHRIIKYVWIAAVVLILFGGVPWVGYTMHKNHFATHTDGLLISMICVLVIIASVVRGLSLRLSIASHDNLGCGHALQQLEQPGPAEVHGAHPVDGACILSFVLSMLTLSYCCSSYPVNSWFSLRFEKASIYLDTARECYEAYVRMYACCASER